MVLSAMTPDSDVTEQDIDQAISELAKLISQFGQHKTDDPDEKELTKHKDNMKNSMDHIKNISDSLRKSSESKMLKVNIPKDIVQLMN
jgi:hypothetical protein